VRVPTPVVSLSDFAIVTKRPVTVEEVNEAFKKAAGEPFFQGILDVTEEELVSSDFIGNSHSAIVDLKLTNVVGGNLLKVVAWYDNEWGYSNRLVELTADTGRILQEGTDKVIPETPADQPAAAPTPAADAAAPAEPMLPPPSVDDALPPPPMGQETNEPSHEVQDGHQPVEGVPGLETPADTLPEQQTPGFQPEDPAAGPDRPHNF
jgi:hypothetical protein